MPRHAPSLVHMSEDCVDQPFDRFNLSRTRVLVVDQAKAGMFRTFARQVKKVGVVCGDNEPLFARGPIENEIVRCCRPQGAVDVNRIDFRSKNCREVGYRRGRKASVDKQMEDRSSWPGRQRTAVCRGGRPRMGLASIKSTAASIVSRSR